MPSRNFFSELKRRNFHKVAVAHVVVAWLIIVVAALAAGLFADFDPVRGDRRFETLPGA